MNYNDACKILNLNTNFTIQQLKHNYFSLALKYHPDKNIGANTTDKFQEIQSAYTYLSNIDIYEESSNIDNSYSTLVRDFLNGVIHKNLDTEKFINMVNKRGEEAKEGPGYQEVLSELQEYEESYATHRSLIVIDDYTGAAIRIFDDLFEMF